MATKITKITKITKELLPAPSERRAIDGLEGEPAIERWVPLLTVVVVSHSCLGEQTRLERVHPCAFIGSSRRVAAADNPA